MKQQVERKQICIVYNAIQIYKEWEIVFELRYVVREIKDGIMLKGCYVLKD